MNLVTRSAAVALVATALSGLALALPSLHHAPSARPAVPAVVVVNADGANVAAADATASPANEDWG